MQRKVTSSQVSARHAHLLDLDAEVSDGSESKEEQKRDTPCSSETIFSFLGATLLGNTFRCLAINGFPIACETACVVVTHVLLIITYHAGTYNNMGRSPPPPNINITSKKCEIIGPKLLKKATTLFKLYFLASALRH